MVPTRRFGNDEDDREVRERITKLEVRMDNVGEAIDRGYRIIGWVAGVVGGAILLAILGLVLKSGVTLPS